MKNIAYIEPPKPYDHQVEAFEFIKEKDYFALFMEQGTGKTKVALMKLTHLFDKEEVNSLIVICPNSIKDQWLYEQIAEHYGRPYAGVIWNGFNSNKARNEFYEMMEMENVLRVFVINVEAFQSNKIDPWLKSFCAATSPLVIVDESTRIKNPLAARTSKILKGFKNRTHKCVLTGTPTPNNPFDLYSQFEFLKEKYFDGISFFQFKHRYGILLTKRNEAAKKNYNTNLDEVSFNRIKNFLNKHKLANTLNEHVLTEASIRYCTTVKNITFINSLKEFCAYKNMDELNQKINKVAFKVMKKDCLDLPDKVYETLSAELSKEQKRLYKSLQKELNATYNGKELTVSNKMVMTMRLQMIAGGNFPYPEMVIKQMISEDGSLYEGIKTEFKSDPIKDNGKLKVLLEDLEEVSDDTQIIIWSPFVNEIKTITKQLIEKGYAAKSYYGGTSKTERPEIIKQFKDKKFRVLVMNPVVGGEGLNLQISTLHYFYSNSYKADDRLQAEDRSHRMGQTNKVTYKDIICKGTVDEKIIKALKQKKNLIDYFRSSSIEDIIY